MYLKLIKNYLKERVLSDSFFPKLKNLKKSVDKTKKESILRT